MPEENGIIAVFKFIFNNYFFIINFCNILDEFINFYICTQQAMLPNYHFIFLNRQFLLAKKAIN